MALQRRHSPTAAGAISLALLLAWIQWPGACGIMICPGSDYVPGPGGDHCYLYHLTPSVFSAANRTCVRASSTMVIIETEVEYNWLYENMFVSFGMQEFWLGLHDQEVDGVFKWIDGTLPQYYNGAPSFADDNTESLDCVKFASDGWTVHSEGCGIGKLPFICEAKLCESDDGEVCNEAVIPVEESDSGGADTVIIAVVVILLLVIIIIVVLVVIFLFMWKFHNDAFHRYCCCCAPRGPKTAVHSLQQENQRLRHELSQHKLSLTGSGRYTQGQFARELSGVPDGRGGVLPTIKQAGSPPVSPTIYEDRPLSLGSPPPPLIPQRGYSRVAPALSRFPSQTRAPFTPPGVFTPGSRLPPATIGGVATLPFIRPGKQLTSNPLATKPPVKRNVFEDDGENEELQLGEKKTEVIHVDTEVVPGEKQVPVVEEEVKPKPKEEDEESGTSSDASSEHEAS